MRNILNPDFKQWNSNGTVDFYCNGNLWLVLDSGEIFPEDPGQGTPVLVCHVDKDGHIKESATYNCATNTGYLDDTYELSESQLNWLQSFEGKIDNFIDKFLD